MTMWLRLYIQVLICLVITLYLYVSLLPNLVSANSDVLVFLGFVGFLLWPALVYLFFNKRVRKFLKCAKF